MATEVPVTPISSDEKTFGMLAHLLAIFTGFIGPLIIWLIKKEESEYVAKQSKESLNFQISIAIYSFVAGLLMVVIIGMILLPAILIFDLIFVILATMKANNGEFYTYPLCIRFIK